MTTKIYRGKISVHDYGESSDNLFIDGGETDIDADEPLADRIECDIEQHGRYLSVNYYITDEPHPQEELQETWLRHVLGAADVEWRVAWSEITGYLWTDEKINVGGHDLLAELVGHDGKFAHLEITYAKEGGQP